MITIYTLRQIFPALRSASDEEATKIRDRLKIVGKRTPDIPLMDLEYALDEQARDIVRRYADIA